MSDRNLVTRQLSTLAVLEEANRANANFALRSGLSIGLLALCCPATTALGSIIQPHGRGFWQRVADTPVWVTALMFVCGIVLGGAGLVVGIRLRREGSDVLAHLRASPEDPIVSSQCSVVVRNGDRNAHFALKSRSGKSFMVLARMADEAKIAAAIDAALPR